MKFLKLPVSLIIITFLMATSCNNAEHKSTPSSGSEAEVSTETLPNGIHRYEIALFSIPDDKFSEGISKLAPEFRVFLGENYTSAEAIARLHDFTSDPQNREVYAECRKRFPDLNQLSDELSTAFERLQEEMPGFRLPEVYTYVSGFDFQYPVKYSDTALIIALDMYMGKDYKGYPKLGIPLYITQRLTPSHIVPDCLKEMAVPLITSKKTPVLLDAMIEEGKILYFADVLLPDTDDPTKIGYSEEQLKWCRDNENNLWSFLIENELLFSAKAESMSMFLTDGPFTSSFSQESPARTGAWLGWQIVRAYMKNYNPGLKNLLADADSQKILEKSGYKPKRK